MYTEFDPYENYTIEDQARDLQISVEECEAYNASGLTWKQWIDETRIEVNIRRQCEYYDRMQEYYDKYGSH